MSTGTSWPRSSCSCRGSLRPACTRDDVEWGGIEGGEATQPQVVPAKFEVGPSGGSVRSVRCQRAVSGEWRPCVDAREKLVEEDSGAEFPAAVGASLLEDRLEVILDRPWREEKAFGERFRAQSCRYERCNLAFEGAE